MSPNYMQPIFAALGGIVLGLAIGRVLSSRRCGKDEEEEYSVADQTKRHAHAVQTNNLRVLNIDTCYNPSYSRNKVVLVTGEKC
ncbi:hypothetical protein EON65_00655 [archaeon]|nr:MAG: hypothetical protein EON65_00655 [archaeon]